MTTDYYGCLPPSREPPGNAFLKGRRRMAKDRVAEQRAEEVRRRLKQTRTELKWSFWRTVKEIKKTCDVDVYAAEVRRYEGSDDARRPVPTVDYVRAFANASGKQEDYMLAEDVLPYDVRGDVQKAVEDFRELRKKFLSKMPRPATSKKEKQIERRRDAVASVLLLAIGLPVSRKNDPRGWLAGDVLAEIHEDLQVLFWEAFDNRGLGDEELLDRAFKFGSSIPSPAQLPHDGFVDTPNIGEIELRRWWRLQSEALRILLLPNENFRTDNQRLPPNARGGFPTPYRDVMSTPVRISSRDETMMIAREILDQGLLDDGPGVALGVPKGAADPPNQKRERIDTTEEPQEEN